ncbi:Uncharacterised protein [Klebsiella pneumoniae]|uniref:Uncharacterized protein n=1 Tax=Klebsiella pneumoniae TaxID=573 RepID=A0A377XEP5_KLEPN|nr:hypothetical protein [Klebsiella pneumoniae]STV57338.1 Uncharacterised protein [Klebsiella pneumoniae subsp. rhinoscleromatis]STT67574.1 Uncharacterised protein [Klebsiella pneumoniae]STT79327.1 Uncharacterised protein [Klebsiella pneumoniae]STU07741.1 Uncharacterised protein [Klebsiella pneumoniae]STV75921.1 Uncharacterised protein [Klebsiella pneumoniae subsp. rhinoscleromatis]
MPKSPAERKAAQRARQSAAGERKIELVLDEQEQEMLAFLVNRADWQREDDIPIM